MIDLKRQVQSHQETLGKLHSEREDLMLKIQAGEGTNAALQQLQDQNVSFFVIFLRNIVGQKIFKKSGQKNS